MDASGIAPTCPNPTIPMLSIERLCPLGAQSSVFTFPSHKIYKVYRRTAMCSTTVHQGVKDISHSYQKVGRMNEESKGLPEVRMGLTPSNTKPSNKDWASPARAEFFKKLFLLSIGVVHLTSATLISLKFEPI